MNETEHLMTCLAEESAEVAQRVSKALRFGMKEVQEGQQLTNAERVVVELVDVFVVAQLLAERGELPALDKMLPSMGEAKREKVARFMQFSRDKGALT